MGEAKRRHLTEWLEMSGSQQAGRRFLARPGRTSCVVVDATGHLPARALQDEAVRVLLHDEGSNVLVLFARALVSSVMIVGPKARELADRLGAALRKERGAMVGIKRRQQVDAAQWVPTVLGTTLATQGRLGLFVTPTRMAGLRARLAMRENRFVFAKAELAIATGRDPDPHYQRLPRAVWRVRYLAVPGYASGNVLVRAIDKQEAMEIAGRRVAEVAASRTRAPVEHSVAMIISSDLQAIALPRSRSKGAGGRYPRRYENQKDPRRDPICVGRRSGPFAQHRRRKN